MLAYPKLLAESTGYLLTAGDPMQCQNTPKNYFDTFTTIQHYMSTQT